MEGLNTESLNAKWLQSQKLIQDEKIESEKPLKDISSENFIKFHSKRGCYNTITFTSADSMPSVFTRKQSLEPTKPQICVITGLPAKYRDPRTNLYYANIKAYKEIKKRYHGRHSAVILN